MEKRTCEWHKDRGREYWPQLLTDLRLWSVHSLLLHHTHTQTHTHTHKHTFTFTRSPLISPSHHQKPSLFSLLSIPIFHILFPPPPPPPPPPSPPAPPLHPRAPWFGYLSSACHTHARMCPRAHALQWLFIFVHLIVSICLTVTPLSNLPSCLTGSYWLARTLVILPVSHPPVQSPHLHMRIVFQTPPQPSPSISIYPCLHSFIITPPLTLISLQRCTLWTPFLHPTSLFSLLSFPALL